MRLAQKDLINQELIQWFGRTIQSPKGVHFFYTGSGFQVHMIGSELLATFEVDYEEKTKHPYIVVFVIQPERTTQYTYRLDQGVHTITLCKVPFGEYTIEIRKRSESMMSRTILVDLLSDGAFKVLNQEEKKWKIEWIGDSLTCGYGNLGENENTPFSTKDEDGMQSFATLASQIVQADYDIVAVSGIGVYKSIYANVTMPNIYKQYDIYDQTPYPFNKQKDLIIMNIGSNDNSYMRFLIDHSRDYEKEKFKKAYLEFIKTVIACNPQAKILCISQGKRQEYVDQIIEDVVNNLDSKIVFHLRISNILESDGIGSQYHPKVITHQRWAKEIASYITQILHQEEQQ